MKVLLLNGSPHQKGSTYTALRAVADAIEGEGLESEIVWLGNAPVRDCIGCGQCSRADKCCFDDDIVNILLEKSAAADGLIVGTPVYYAHANGRILSVLDRLFYAGSDKLSHKPGAAVAVARRGGCSSALDDLNKYFTIAEMPLVSSSYWNMAYGACADDVLKDSEGLQTMANLGRNMAWLIKCIAAGRDNGVALPENRYDSRTNFIR